MTRIILFTGKGGVGKTTIASATALKCSQLGYKTLIISSDPAHSLSDSFNTQLSYKPTKIDENLYGMEVNIEKEIERHWEVIKNYLSIFFKSQGINDVVAEELAIFPGFDELATLLHILEFYENNNFDVLILDCAPTGETLRLLSVPEVARWYMNRFFGIEKKLLKIVRPIAEPIIDLPLPSDEVLDKVQELYFKIAKVKEILESENTTIRIVMNAEKMVIKESERAFTYLSLFGYTTDAIIVNKLFPRGAGKYLERWIDLQKRYLEEIKSFGLPIFKVKFRESEVYGQLLYDVADELYDKVDPSDRFVKERAMNIYKDGDNFILSIKAPSIKKEELKLFKRGEELIISTQYWRRILFLPQSLLIRDVVRAKLEDGWLKIYFN